MILRTGDTASPSGGGIEFSSDLPFPHGSIIPPGARRIPVPGCRVQSSACAPGHKPERSRPRLVLCRHQVDKKYRALGARAGTNALQANMRKMNTCEKTGMGYPA